MLSIHERNMRTLSRIQQRRDAMNPPDYFDDHDHHWRRIRGNDEVALYRCMICGEERLD